MLVLVVGIIFAIQTSPVQNFLKDKAVTYLHAKLKTPVSVGHISVLYPKDISIEHVYLADQKGDTLLYSRLLQVNLDLPALLHSKVILRSLNLDGLTAHVTRKKNDSSFNYSYILKAFAGPPNAAPVKKDTSSLQISLGDIDLGHLNISYDDGLLGYHASVIVGKLHTEIKSFDLKHMHFGIHRFLLADLNTRVKQDSVVSVAKSVPVADSPAPASDTTAGIQLDLDQAELKRNRINFASDPLKMKTLLNLGELSIENTRVDMAGMKVHVGKISLHDTETLLDFLKTRQAKTLASDKKSEHASSKIAHAAAKTGRAIKLASDSAGRASFSNTASSNSQPAGGTGWKVDVGSTDLENIGLQMDNDNFKAAKTGMDYNHIQVKGFDLKTSNLHYEPAFIKVILDKLQMQEKCGFAIRKGQGDIYFDPRHIKLDKLDIATAESELAARADLRFDSLGALSTRPGDLILDLDVSPSILGLKDILYFQPGLAKTDPFKKAGSTKIKLNARASGYVKDLNIGRLEASALSGTHLLVSGKLKGLPDPQKLQMDILLSDLSSTSGDIGALVSKGTLPASVHLPSRFKVKSTLKGSMKDLDYTAALASTLGNANADGYLKLGARGGDTAYKVNLTLRQLQAGVLSGQPKMLGLVNADLYAEGKGLSPKRASAKMRLNVADAFVKGYHYHNLHLSGEADHGRGSLAGGIKDPNLSFALAGSGDFSRQAPAFKVNLRLDSADFKALHMSTSAQKLRLNLLADVPSADINHPEGRLDVTHFLMVTDSASIPLDTLSLVCHSQGSKKSIFVKSEFLKAALEGKISLPDVASQLTAQLNHYYRFTKASPPKKQPEEDFTFHALILGPPSLHKLVPSLASFRPVTITGLYQSRQNLLELHASAPKTQYGGITVDSLRLNLKGDASRLNYELLVDSVSSSSFDLESTKLSGYAADSKLHVSLGIMDDAKKTKYALAALLAENKGIYQFSLQPGLVLNYDPWTVSADNLIEYSPKGIRARDLRLAYQSSELSVNSTRPEFNAPLKVAFAHFDLATLSRLIEKDSVLVRGTLEGQAVADKLLSGPVFTSDLLLKDFSFRKDTLGNISLKVNNQTAGAYAADVEVTGRGNNASLKGLYYTQTSSFNLKLLLDRLNLASIQSYTFGQMKQGKGYINGKFDITGTTTRPNIAGFLGFKQASFNLTYLNSILKVPDQQIDFDNKGIHLYDFTLQDSAKNQLDIDGDILTSNYQNFNFDLTISSTDFRILNTTAKDNPNFYGRVYLNSDIDITGDLNKPKIDANITLNKRTNFTYVIPADDPSLEERKGIVEFVSKKQLLLAPPKKKEKNDAFKGIDFSANLEIDKDAAFTVIIDQQTGDALKVKGEATLNTTIDPSGKISLTGRYEIGEGSYQLTVNNFIKKSFNIKKGSSITWTGEPTMADVDITAVYIASAPSIDLMEQQENDPATNNKYKQKLPFNLNLMMKGQLLSPSITFSIDLPEKEANLNAEVKTRLDQLAQDPNEENKQVFALLLLGRFVGQNPLQSQSGGGLNAGLIARQSAGKLLSQQLNNLAGSLIKGVDLNFNLNSQDDYSSGQQATKTDLQIGATKNFNDRLSVGVGSDINLEGANGASNTASNLIGDVNVEYKVSRDGRYRLRAFRRNATEEFVEGQFIETGLSFIFVVDYDKLKDAFRATKAEKPGLVAPRLKKPNDTK